VRRGPYWLDQIVLQSVNVYHLILVLLKLCCKSNLALLPLHFGKFPTATISSKTLTRYTLYTLNSSTDVRVITNSLIILQFCLKVVTVMRLREGTH